MGNGVDLEVPAERIMVWHIPRISRQDDVSQLDAVLRKTVDEVEVEVAEELGEVVPDDEDYP